MAFDLSGMLVLGSLQCSVDCIRTQSVNHKACLWAAASSTRWLCILQLAEALLTYFPALGADLEICMQLQAAMAPTELCRCVSVSCMFGSAMNCSGDLARIQVIQQQCGC